MTDYTFWDCLKDYQILIGGMLGFLGVILALIYNSIQLRSQNRKEQFRERQKLRVALIEELKATQHALRYCASQLKEDYSPVSEFWVPTHNFDNVFNAHIGRLGSLTPREVRRVLNAYLSIKTYTASLVLHSRLSERARIDPRYVAIPIDRRKRLISMQESLCSPIAQALEALTKTQKEEKHS